MHERFIGQAVTPTPGSFAAEGMAPGAPALSARFTWNDRPIEVSTLPRSVALADEDLIRTKVNLIPEVVTDIRVVDIAGLDKQADGGTHVKRTGEVGRVEIVKTESKGRGNKRVRLAIHDAAPQGARGSSTGS